MRLLAFSDVHTDLDAARRLVELSTDADVVIGAGDFCSVHERLRPTIDTLSEIDRPTVLVPGNNETEDELREACASWAAARILHGEPAELDGVPFFGLGAGVPVTPWDWSFDLDEAEAARMLSGCPEDAVLVVHSPPKGHTDRGSGGQSLGSEAILETIERTQPRLAVCGHIHDCWGESSQAGGTPVYNLGPSGTFLEV